MQIYFILRVNIVQLLLKAGQQPEDFGLSAPQKALVTTIQHGHRSLSSAMDDLPKRANLSSLGDVTSQKWKDTQYNSNKENVVSQVSAMNAATAQVVRTVL